jgi:hypothetical protein
MKLNFNVRTLTSVTALAFIVSSCGEDFSAVQNFGELSGSVRETSIGVSNDIYASCIRSINFISLNSPNSLAVREQQEETCNEESKPAVASTIAVNAILIGYIEALGKLGNNKVASPAQSISDLGKSLRQLKIPLGSNKFFQLDGTSVDAGTKIVTFLAKALTDGFRQERIKQTVLCTNNDIQAYSKGLQALVQDGYSGVLVAEKLQIRAYYTSLIGDLTLKKASPLDFDNLRDKLTRDIQVVQQKEQNARDYLDVLRTTAETHQGLYEIFLGKGKSKISSAELTTLCKDFFANSKDTQLANNKAVLKPNESREANKLIVQYRKDLERLTSRK